MTEYTRHLSRFGFRFGRGGAHTSRTMMLQELRALLAHVDSPQAKRADYQAAIYLENCLGKRSVKTRELTYSHLVDLYSLDQSHILFRALLYFWSRDQASQPLLALLCAFARDTIFRSTASFILKVSQSATVRRESLEEFIDANQPGRFSNATLKSTAQNINSTWTQSGHLQGRAQKIRIHARPTPGSVAYALLLGYLTGARGQALFQTEYTQLLDCTRDKAIELALVASLRGWIVVKQLGDVIEVLFPHLIQNEEMEWLREQS